MDSTAPILALIDVSKRFEELEAGQPVEVLRHLNLQVSAAETMAIIGPSGSGKSTLLNIIGTLDRPSTGQVMLEGEDLSRATEKQLASIRNRKIGFIFQSHHLLPQCNVMENVLVPTLADGGQRESPAETTARAEKLLRRVGLGERLHHRPGQLSGGERQRVAVVRALINQPKLLLADEPTGALDRVSAESLSRLLVDLNREEGVTLIVVTHALDLARQMETIWELRDGGLHRWQEDAAKAHP